MSANTQMVNLARYPQARWSRELLELAELRADRRLILTVPPKAPLVLALDAVAAARPGRVTIYSDDADTQDRWSDALRTGVASWLTN